MARFKYEGRDTKQIRTGIVTAGNRREAIIKLRDEGIKVIDMREIETTTLQKDITIGNPVKRDQFIMFLRQFSTLMRAGVTIVDTIRILSQQVESKALAKTLAMVEDELRKGNTLSDSLAKHPKIFEPLTINLIKAGEMSGNIDESLERLANHYDKAYQTRQKVVSAMSYPAIVGVLAIGVVIFLLATIVPMFVDMFAGFGGELPLLTQIVMQLSDLTISYWYLIVLAVLALIGAYWLMKRSLQGRLVLDTMLLRMPIFGKIFKKSALARLTRTLSSLFTSSVPILQALTMVEKVVGNEVMSKVVLASRDSLERGGSLTEPMRDHWAFPPLIPHMISIGEQTGSLDHMLLKVAEFYEKEVDAETDRLKALVEPLMIVLLAALVGTIVLSIMLPMFEMFNNVDTM
ncbi:type II secretion system F family protein [Microbacterium sp. APC 3898]|uniref:Type II secretion system F family protein n=1 Tax=Planococcus notacanthi TaxID=3035188 RepID=A0ABT7ZIG4_9BACL|nr:MULTISPECIES: type II secretion system F family protein [Terrabacteria group]MDN3426939.1 type II secretion system F family protein [Planococcus sp. APC 4016]MDN3499913.1 type II secretion system F family protein [Microbacterium sp. APC 3898]